MGRNNFPKNNSAAAFTLIELLLVIAIVGVLAGGVFFALNPGEQFAKTRDAQRKNDFTQIRNALELYYNDNNRYPPSINGLIDGNPWGEPWPSYMGQLPKDPSSGQEYRYEIDEAGAGTEYRLYAKLERCSDPQIIPESNCDDYNYSVTSANVAAAALPTPTPTPAPTSKRVFVTSTKYDGNLGGLSGADGKCQTSANNANLDGTWKAWLSDKSDSADSRLNHAGIPYKLVDGTLIASNWDDLTKGTIANFINKTETNASPGDTTVFTGTNADATRTEFNCNNWLSNSSSGTASYGATNVKDLKWSNWSKTVCSSSRSIYCFEQ